ncbi:MAG: hypothetical protein WBA99_04335 [Nodosilinea sp.]
MAQPKDPKSTPNDRALDTSRSARLSVEAFYQQAMAAFKAQDYDQALARFQRLGKLPSTSPYYLKALIGQVRVHQHLGQADRVRHLCQQLLDSSVPQAQHWASQVLSQLPEQAAELQTTAARSDLSGFVPLGNSKPVSVSQRRLELGHSSIEATDPNQAVTEAANAQVNTDRVHPETSGPEALGPGISGPNARSLFHYHQLNQQPAPESKGTEATAPSPTPAVAASSPMSPPASSVSAPAAPQGRSQPVPQPQPLPKRPLTLWLGQGLTAIALVWITNWAFHFVLRTADRILRWVRWPVQLSLPGAYQTYTVWVVLSLVLLALASPWLMDFALATWYRQRPLSIRQLQTYSPSSLRLLRQVCRQQGWPIPELRLIADPAPLCFSYGWLPRYTRIVVSQGWLDQSSDQALATVYSYELARLVNGSLPMLSAVGLPLLLLHTGYRGLAQRADTSNQPLRSLLGSGASLLYGLFWLLRQAVLWLSRLCCRWGDRRVSVLTQQPSQMIEMMVNATAAIAAYLQQHGTLHPLHISLEVLMPISSRQAISAGGLLSLGGSDRTTVLSTLLAVDGLNPYRQWLQVNASHHPLGDRLRWFNQQALHRYQPSLIPTPDESSGPPPFAAATVSLPLLLLQKGPLAGLAAGGSLAMGLWFVGGVVNRLGWQRLSWLYQDPSILTGGLWLGLGLGLLLRINTLFPEPSSQTAHDPSEKTVAALLQHPALLPVQGQPISLRGQLRGLAGAGNWGCQELYLEDTSGLVKLINPVPLGSLQGLIQPQTHPLNWVGRRVTVTGWSRYGGGMLWVDIDQVTLDQRHQFSTHGPVWATLISLISSLIGILAIVRGG